MIINQQSIDLVFRGFKAVYAKAFDATPSQQEEIAMTVTSESREEQYGWLGEMPRMREWIGSRIIHGLSTHGFTIKNKNFESTVSVQRNDMADDKIGVYTPMFSELGRESKQHPDEMVFGLLGDGFNSLCYDGQNFFDEEHPVVMSNSAEPELVSNMQAGAGDTWVLIDASRAVRPIVWQVREPYRFTAVTDPAHPTVFFNDEFVFGINARVNCGFGLWQLAFGSKATLDKTNYAAARAAMANFRGDQGKKLGVRPTHLVVPSSLEEQALELINAERNGAGATNVWKDTAKLIITPHLG